MCEEFFKTILFLMVLASMSSCFTRSIYCLINNINLFYSLARGPRVVGGVALHGTGAVPLLLVGGG